MPDGARHPTARVTIAEATLRDMSYIAANMREADRREIGAVIDQPPIVIACMLYEGSPGFRWVASLDGQPVCAFGVSTMLPGLGSGWAFMQQSGLRTMKAVTIFCRRVVKPRLLDAGFRRVEVRTSVDHDLSHRWLDRLGFVREGIAVDYGTGGLAFATYAATHRSAARLIR